MLSFSNEEEGEEGEEGSAENILPTKMISAPIIKNNQKKSNSKNSNNKDIDESKNGDNFDNKDKNGKKSESDIKIDEEKYQKMLQDAKKKAAQYNFDDDDDDDEEEEEVKGGSSSGGGGGEGEKRGGEEGGAGDSFRGHYEDSEEAIKKKMLKDKGDYCLVMYVVSVHKRPHHTYVHDTVTHRHIDTHECT